MSPRVAVVCLLASCKLENPPYDEGSSNLLVDLEAALSPSATVTQLGVGGPTRGVVSAWPLDDGGAAVLIGSVGMKSAVVRMTSEGFLRTVEVAEPSTGTSLGDEAALLDCPFGPRFGLTDPDRGYVEYYPFFADPLLRYRPCGGALGVGATSDRVLQVDVEFIGVYLHELDRAQEIDNVSTLVVAPPIPAGALVLLVYERALGSVSYVLDVAGELVFLDDAGSSVTATGIDGTLAAAWFGDDGDVRIATSEALYRWDAATEEATLLAEVPNAPTGTDWVSGGWPGGAYAEAGDPNPGAPDLTVPTAMAVRYATDADFEVFTPPLTPCCDPDACREQGESYLIGGLGTDAGEVVVYDVWTWFGTDEQFTHIGVTRTLDDGCG